MVTGQTDRRQIHNTQLFFDSHIVANVKISFGQMDLASGQP